MAEVPKVDEFSFILMASILFIFIMAFAWTTPTESPPVVAETSFDLSAVAGETTSFEFIVTGNPRLTAVNLSASGEIRNWITFSKNNFDVDDPERIKVTIKVPANVTEGVHNGRVFLFGQGGKDQFSISMDVSGERREMQTRRIPQDQFEPDFTVSYYEGTDILDSETDKRVSKSHFSMRTMTLIGSLTEKKASIVTGGNIRIVIEDTNAIGSLIVELNDEEIYKRKPGEGEIVIRVDKDDIETSNVIMIKTTPPGLIFWASSYYDIKVAEFNVDYEGAFAKMSDFVLSDDEVDNFKDFNLIYTVNGYTAPLPEMMIKINNQIVYWDTPPMVLFDDKISEDMFGNPLYLNDGVNTLTFMFEEPAEYRITNALLLVEYYD